MNRIVPGTELPKKGRLLLTDGPSFAVCEYTQINLLFKNPNTSESSSMEFMPVNLICDSLRLLIRDYYIPCTGWIDVEDEEIYLSWDNYKDGIYSPRFPVEIETATIDTDYDTFYEMVQNGDPLLEHSKMLECSKARGRDAPIMLFKVTRLGPGNQAVAISNSCCHALMDACSGAIFLINWASICSQMMDNPELQLSSGRASYTIPHPPLFGTPDFSKFRNPNSENYIENFEDNIYDPQASYVKPEEINEYCLMISETKQKEIREKAHQSGVSFNNYLFALFWKEEINLQVAQKPEIADSISSFSIPINIRPFIGVSMNLCSSAVIGYSVKTKVQDILEMSVIDLAQMIKKRIESASTPEGICGFVDKLISYWRDGCNEGGDSYDNFKKRYIRGLSGTPKLLASSMLNFRLADVDFGSGGPVCLRLPKRQVSGSILISPPNRNVIDNNIQLYATFSKNLDISESEILSELVAPS